MKCSCDTDTIFMGNKADAYAKEHLIKVGGRNWEIDYVCPDTGQRWIKDFPQSRLQGGGPPRLRRLTEPEVEAVPFKA